MLPKSPRNVLSGQKSSDEEVGRRRSTRQSEKKKEDISEIPPNPCNHSSRDSVKKENSTNKRKAEECLKDEKEEKSQKLDQMHSPKEDTSFPPRRSSRGVVPNRKFKDMEVSYTPVKRSSKEEQKVEAQKPTAKTTKKQKKTPISKVLVKHERNASDSSNDETEIVAEIKQESTGMFIPETGKMAEHENCNENKEKKNVSDIKLVKLDKDDKTESTFPKFEENNDINSKEMTDGSETPDFSIIQEEDLERITSELLELAQNAEQEHHQMQKSISNQTMSVSGVCVSVANMEIIQVELPSDSEHGQGNVDDSVLTGQSENSEVGKLLSTSTLETSVKDSNELKNSDKNSGLIQEDNESVMVENIMQRKNSPQASSEHVANESNTTDCEKEKDCQLTDGKLQKDSSKRADIIPLSLEDPEIQMAVKNALLQMAENTEGKEPEKEAEQGNRSDEEKLDSISSSATQTSSEKVIKLPAITVKPRNSPNVKSITVNVETPGQIDENGQKKKTLESSKQEFIIVHVPDGRVVKRTTVRLEKPEDLIPYRLEDDGIYYCGVCEYSNDKKLNLLKHRKKHVDKSHCCPYCDYKTSTSSNLKRHISIHQDIRNFRCHLCNTTFRQKIHLERHIRYRHEEKKVKCPLCDYVCANENPDLKVHMKRRHLPQDNEDGSITAFKCTECDLVTVNRKDFKQHMKFHRGGPELKLFCEHCSFVTDCESRLRRHSYIHTKEKPFQCGMCEYKATQKEHVVRHMRSQHGVEIERNRRKLDDEDSLDDSIDSTDEASETKQGGTQKVEKFDYTSQEKIFACNHCSMKFAKLLNLYKHLHAQHKDILPEQTDDEYLCVVCDFKTTTKKNLLVHMRKHNQVDQIPPSHVYSCVLCNYINPKRRNLFQHMKKKHGIEIVMKDDGSTSCFVTDGSVLSSKCDETVQNILTIGDVVTTETEHQELQIVTDDLEKDGIQVQNVISFDDIAYAVSHPQPHNRNLIVVEPNNALIQEQGAAEAIEGLQALAEQPGIIVGQEVMTEVPPQLMTLEEVSEDKLKHDSKHYTAETELVTESEMITERPENETGIEISTEDVMQLSAGDFVEIDGEMYKVEIREDENITLDNEIDTSST